MRITRRRMAAALAAAALAVSLFAAPAGAGSQPEARCYVPPGRPSCI
jgi:hypothetical protein